ASQVLGVLFALVALRIVAGRDWLRRVGGRPPRLIHLILVVAAWPAAMMLGDALVEGAKVYLPSPSWGMEEAMKAMQSWPWWLGVVLIGVGPALNEELFFRAFLGRGLVGSHGPVFGVVVTSLLFGLAHIDPVQATMAFVMGIVLHFIYLTGRSLWLP